MRTFLFLMLSIGACGTPPKNDPAPTPGKNTEVVTAPPVTTPPNQKSEPYPDPPQLTPPTEAQMKERSEWFACEVDADCEFVEMLSCGHCNAGFALSVNKKFAKEAKNTWGKEGNFACTELDCADYTATCQDKICASTSSNGTTRPNPVTR